MHWLLQNNLGDEPGYDALVAHLEREGIAHSVVKVVPFSGDLSPEPDLADPIVVFGSVALVRTAVRRGWRPGAWFDEEALTVEAWQERYRGHLLNADSRIMPFSEVRFSGDMFLRPNEDTKSFAGALMSWDEFQPWQARVLALGGEESSAATITPETLVALAEPKAILSEHRFFVVDGEVVTASQYKRGNRVSHARDVDQEAWRFAEERCRQWQPDRGFALDVALTEAGPKVVEVNCLNAAGFYACDVTALVRAIEAMAL